MTHPDMVVDKPEDLLGRLLEAAAKAGIAEHEVYLVRKNSLAIAIKDGAVDQVRRNQEYAASLRFVEENRLGFGYTSVFTPEALDQTVRQAASGARLTDPQPGMCLPPPPSLPWPSVEVFDEDLDRIPLAEKIEGVRAMETSALETDPRVEKVRQAEYNESTFSIWLSNSLGLQYHHSGTAVWGNLMVKANDGNEAEMGYDFDFARRYRDLKMPAIGRRAAVRALSSLGGKRIPTGRRPVILENSVAAEFLDVLSSSFLADNAQKGKSLLTGREGRQIMASGVTLIDDGLYPGGLATAPADAEGVPKRKTVLVNRGVMESMLYDHPRAQVAGRASTGNAGRGDVKSPPAISTSNFYMAPGTRTQSELARDLGEGLLVTEVMGLHTADPISGDFSLGVSGIWLHDGLPQHPVKGMAIAGNLLKVFEQVAEIGADLRFFGAIGAPSLLIHELTVSGS